MSSSRFVRSGMTYRLYGAAPLWSPEGLTLTQESRSNEAFKKNKIK